MQTLEHTSSIKTTDLPRLPAAHPLPMRWLFVMLKGLLWSVIGLLITLIVLEFILAGVHAGEQQWFKINPVIGFVHLENKMLTFRGEGFSRERFNSAGYCDVERTLQKPAGVFRIAVLGDSETEALQVPLQDRFTNRLEARLNKDQPHKFEVLNFGMSSYSTGQEYLQYLQNVVAYQPDLTIVCYHNGDEQEDVDLSSLRPSFSCTRNGALAVRWVEFDRFRKSDAAKPLTSFEWGWKNSRALSILWDTHRGLKATAPLYAQLCDCSAKIIHAIGRMISHIHFAANDTTSLNKDSAKETQIALKRLLICRQAGLAIDTSVRKYPQGTIDYWDDRVLNLPPTTYQDRLQVTRVIIGYLAKACRQTHGRLAVVSLPLIDQKDSLQSTLDWYASVQQPQPIPVLNMYPTFASAQSRQADPLLFPSSHFTENGHKLATKLLYNFLTSNHLLDPTTVQPEIVH